MAAHARPVLDMGDEADQTCLHREPGSEARIVVFDVDDPKRVEGMLEPDTAHFESVFETGNLRAAVRVRTYDCSGVPSTTLHDQVYELYLRHDVCYPAEVCWWFHFSVTNIVPGVPYEFRIVNMQRKGNFFSRGMCPVMYSVHEAVHNGGGWTRCGRNVQYHPTPLLPSERLAAMSPHPAKVDRSWKRVKDFLKARFPGTRLFDAVRALVGPSHSLHRAMTESSVLELLHKSKHSEFPDAREDHETSVHEPGAVPGPESKVPSLGIVAEGESPLTLRFTVTFVHKDDVCFFAPSFPYGQSTLENFLTGAVGQPQCVHEDALDAHVHAFDRPDAKLTRSPEKPVRRLSRPMSAASLSGSLRREAEASSAKEPVIKPIADLTEAQSAMLHRKLPMVCPPGLVAYGPQASHPDVLEYATRTVLCKSIEGQLVEYVTVTSRNISKPLTLSMAKKPVIALLGRQHPGESSASFVMEGVLQELLSEHPVSAALRDWFEFQVFPMVNIDGTINGNYMNGLTGYDFNTVWDDPDRDRQPEVYHIKQHLRSVAAADDRLLACIDVHAHSSKPGVFLYGCTGDRAQFDRPHCITRETHGGTTGKFGIDDDMLGQDPRAFAVALSKTIPEFSTESSKFGVTKSKAGCFRAVAWYEMRVPLSVTLETSLVGSDKSDYTPNDYRSIGGGLVQGIARYFGVDPAPPGSIDIMRYTAQSVAVSTPRSRSAAASPTSKPAFK